MQICYLVEWSKVPRHCVAQNLANLDSANYYSWQSGRIFKLGVMMLSSLYGHAASCLMDFCRPSIHHLTTPAIS